MLKNCDFHPHGLENAVLVSTVCNFKSFPSLWFTTYCDSSPCGLELFNILVPCTLKGGIMPGTKIATHYKRQKLEISKPQGLKS